MYCKCVIGSRKGDDSLILATRLQGFSGFTRVLCPYIIQRVLSSIESGNPVSDVVLDFTFQNRTFALKLFTTSKNVCTVCYYYAVT